MRTQRKCRLKVMCLQYKKTPVSAFSLAGTGVIISCGATRLDMVSSIPTQRIQTYADFDNGVSAPAHLLNLPRFYTESASVHYWFYDESAFARSRFFGLPSEAHSPKFHAPHSHHQRLSEPILLSYLLFLNGFVLRKRFIFAVL